MSRRVPVPLCTVPFRFSAKIPRKILSLTLFSRTIGLSHGSRMSADTLRPLEEEIVSDAAA